MERKVGKFSFSVPEGHPQAGEKIEKPFEYDVCSNDDEAMQVIADKKWNIVSMVNDAIKTNARSNAYQKSLAAYQPVEDPAKVRETMIKNYIRLGIAEDVATKQVDALLATAEKGTE